MSERSAAFIRLCDAALQQFAQAGYDGTSLTAIAEAVGIRKASIYSHIAGKDELYLLILSDAIAAETAFAERCFGGETQDLMPGEAYLAALSERYAGSLHLQFLLRAAYFSPALHREAVTLRFVSVIDGLRALYLSRFTAHFAGTAQADLSEIFAENWLGVFDSLCVELLYAAATPIDLRRDAMLAVMRRALMG